jgi:hypothetical protein
MNSSGIVNGFANSTKRDIAPEVAGEGAAAHAHFEFAADDNQTIIESPKRI